MKTGIHFFKTFAMKCLLGALGLMSLTIFTSCKSHEKKILIYASSTIQADESQKNITVTEGTTHYEKELDFSGSDPVSIHIQAPGGAYTLEAKDDGYYIANLKNDTVVGSMQRVGLTGSNRVTQDEAIRKTDSLEKLVTGANVSEANHNYFIPPGKMVKVTTELNAKIFGPYTSIPAAFDPGSVPELYKFYTNKETREIIDRLKKMTGSSPAAEKEEKK